MAFGHRVGRHPEQHPSAAVNAQAIAENKRAAGKPPSFFNTGTAPIYSSIRVEILI
jgi:hypothetical protein